MANVKNLKQAVMPIIWLNCIFCMGIFEIPINRPRYFLSISYVLSMLTGYFVLLYKEINIFHKLLIKQFMIFYFVMGVNILVAIMAILLFWWKSENMTKIIKRNNIADNTLEALGIKTEYQKTFRNILCLVAIWVIGMIKLIIIHVAWMYHDIGYWDLFYCNICVCFPIMVNSAVDLTFSSFISVVNRNLESVALTASLDDSFVLLKSSTRATACEVIVSVVCAFSHPMNVSFFVICVLSHFLLNILSVRDGFKCNIIIKFIINHQLDLPYTFLDTLSFSQSASAYTFNFFKYLTVFLVFVQSI
ncbi:hypothetical protein PUN28_011833 [Cardiocondyla obscurior]|uniref:Gustatory receptor n=1 Tax=Cardiocondyla obscurior TaxID=286306 RepID=A0AAW2FKW6_9HYME